METGGGVTEITAFVVGSLAGEGGGFSPFAEFLVDSFANLTVISEGGTKVLSWTHFVSFSAVTGAYLTILPYLTE